MEPDDPFGWITKEARMSSSMDSAFRNCSYWVPSDSDDSISDTRNPAVIPQESDRIVMVSPPESVEDEEVLYTPPVAEESMDFVGETVPTEVDNGRAVNLERDTDLGFSKRLDLDDSDPDSLELLESLKNLSPGSDVESELQNLCFNFEAGGPSVKRSRPDISTETRERNMRSENISIPKAREDEPKRKRALPPSWLKSSVEKDEEPKAERNLTSPVNVTGSVGEDGRVDVEEQNANEREPVDPVMPDTLDDNSQQIPVFDVLLQLLRNLQDNDVEEDKRLACLSLLEVAEERWGPF